MGRANVQRSSSSYTSFKNHWALLPISKISQVLFPRSPHFRSQLAIYTVLDVRLGKSSDINTTELILNNVKIKTLCKHPVFASVPWLKPKPLFALLIVTDFQ